MGGKQEAIERKKIASAHVLKAQEVLTQYNQLLFQPDMVLTVPALDHTKPEDQWLAVELSMRGRTREEYFSIVDGLFIAHDSETDKAKKGALTDLTSQIMSLGERNLGIDWS